MYVPCTSKTVETTQTLNSRGLVKWGLQRQDCIAVSHHGVSTWSSFLVFPSCLTLRLTWVPSGILPKWQCVTSEARSQRRRSFCLVRSHSHFLWDRSLWGTQTARCVDTQRSSGTATSKSATCQPCPLTTLEAPPPAPVQALGDAAQTRGPEAELPGRATLKLLTHRKHEK